ncbi:hypothetical protein HAX54_043721 [Datura stramonium]|uniref:Uncharacterized protein n=1 Tax=Datura stramonium TaxID=4076 RepID=A0ABS8W4V5_DATST|nr:hypothetical protein [Datura stramonium]
MARSDSDSDEESSEVSTLAQSRGTDKETDFLNVPSEPEYEQENSRGTNPENNGGSQNSGSLGEDESVRGDTDSSTEDDVVSFFVSESFDDLVPIEALRIGAQKLARVDAKGLGIAKKLRFDSDPASRTRARKPQCPTLLPPLVPCQ